MKDPSSWGFSFCFILFCIVSCFTSFCISFKKKSSLKLGLWVGLFKCTYGENRPFIIFNESELVNFLAGEEET